MKTEAPALFDLTLELSKDTLLYPGDPPPEITRVSDIGRGDLLTASQISMNCHVGTHVDAPAHFLADGKTLDARPLTAFYGPAVVVELRGEKRWVDLEDVRALELPTRHHILLKTRNSQLLKLRDFNGLLTLIWLDQHLAIGHVIDVLL